VFCLHDFFESRVDLHPASPAIACGDTTMSYEEVERRANQLARYLRGEGVKTGALVGLFIERSPDAIVAILAILKAGAAYLPLDPAHPAERIRHILDEASITTLVSESQLGLQALGFLDRARVGFIAIDDPARPWVRESTARLTRSETGVTSSDLSYVLYTSGSTGRPKGVMTEHGNVVAFVRSFNQVLGLTAQDRVFQGFSLGFDGSVEEMWMAFSNGGTLVVPPRGAARFGDDLAQLITRGRASVFSTVPTSLAMISDPLPTVRVLIVSGERCPDEAVRRWATPDRRMLNVYGPTETTVNATVAVCAPGRAVTVGSALPGYGLHILDEAGRPVDRGDQGELYISGPGVARGYLAQPELTAKHFVELPVGVGGEDSDSDSGSGDDSDDAVARAYRTGDLVSVAGDGELLFHGRLDSQIKVRGYRIELSEIENVLCEHESIRTAAVTVVDRDGAGTLAAFVLARDGAAGVDRNGVLRHLTARLPAYMVPGYLDVVEALPTLASGKIDRARLPTPAAALVRTDRPIRAPADALEASLLQTYARLLRNDAISTDDDFFLALGGYSLLAAQLVSELRQRLGLEVAIRDIYSHPTIADLAAHLRSKGAGGASSRPEPPAARSTAKMAAQRARGLFARTARGAGAAVQALGLYAVYAVMALPFLGTLLPFHAWRAGRLSLASCLGVCLLVWLATWPALLALSVAAKWILIGRYRPGTYRLGGWYALRFWLVRRFQMITGSALLAGTPLLPLYLRAMGAKIGRGCVIGTPYFGVFDLLRLGDDTSVGVESQLLGYRVEDGHLIIGAVDIGSRCFVGTHCALGIDVRMGNDARLDDQSLLPDGGWIPPGESRRGSPAQAAKVCVPEPAADAAFARRRPALFGAAHLAALYAIFLLLLPAEIPGGALLWRAEEARSVGWLIAAVPAIGTVTFVAFCLWLAALNHLVLPSVRPGVYRVESFFYVRKWAADLLMQLSRTFARPLYTTIYLPAWLRLLGARIGRRAEISTVAQMSPKLTRIGDQSFFADGSMIGGNRIHRGLVELRESRIGRRSFVGNGAILPVGASLGDNCLLGCLSAPPAGHARTRDGTEWLGSPSFALPRRPRVGGFDASVTHEPTRKLIAQRLLIDGLRIVLPATLVTGAFIGLSALVEHGRETLPLGVWLLGVPLAEMAIAAAALLCVVATKKILIGTFKPTVQPLWSVFVWLNEALNGVYETVAAPVLTLLLGSPYAAPWLRLMGCAIGRDVYLETTLFSEFDLVHIGDGVALNAGAVIQNHLFEDRIMKVSAVEIGDRCTVGNMAVVLYDTEMQAGSSIGPLSLLMKGETLPPQTRWLGIPTAQAAAPVADPRLPVGAPPVVGAELLQEVALDAAR
jgi:non-ribosomal peptide synthetase-like protein